ncbi:MAG TPA: DsrE family protein [Candidatus Polarisedimenticolia bacterium]|jgi:sulfur relay (sulfurtransferase) DsrF/TusC family protein
MAKKILQIVQSAFRATLEEQDDTVIWISHAMKGSGGELGVLLRGNAVNYAVRGQDASGLSFGERKQTQPPRLDDDLAKLIGKGVDVYLVEEDLAERGLERTDLIQGPKTVRRAGLPALFDTFDQVWHW